jgi:hypothetical protein
MRRVRRHPFAVIAGTVLVVLAALLGLVLARPRHAPVPTEDMSLQFVAPDLPAFGRGFIEDVTIVPPAHKFCTGTTQVSVVVQGSREFWDDHMTEYSGRSPVALGFAGFSVQRPRAYLLATPQDIDRLRAHDSPIHVAARLPVSVRAIKHLGALTVSVSDWADRRFPLAFLFDAPDLSTRRDSESCWVQIPALTGPISTLGAAIAEATLHLPTAPTLNEFLSGDADPRPSVTVARATVVNAFGASPIEAEPAPDSSSQRGAVWNCHSLGLPKRLRPHDVITITNDGSVVRHMHERSGSPPIAAFESASREPTCAATVAVAALGVSATTLNFAAGVLLTFGVGLLLFPFASAEPSESRESRSEPAEMS